MIDIAVVSARMAMNCEAGMCNSMHIMGRRDSVADRPKGLPDGAFERLCRSKPVLTGGEESQVNECAPKQTADSSPGLRPDSE
jgi:hypothetical protein